ncbi:MAG: hypothetical protein WDN46_06920 [Methylocella sp.]
MTKECPIAPEKRPRTPRKPLEEEAPITAESLRTLINQLKLNPRLKPPSDEALVKLADLLEGWRQHYLIEQNISLPIREMQNEAHAAIDKLIDIIGSLKERNGAFHAKAVEESATTFEKSILETRLAEIEEAKSAIQRIAGSSFLEDYSIQPRGWKWLAAALQVDFHNAMRSTNPGYKTRLSDKAPLPLFITAIAPFLTGESPRIGSVTTQLKNLQKR